MHHRLFGDLNIEISDQCRLKILLFLEIRQITCLKLCSIYVRFQLNCLHECKYFLQYKDQLPVKSLLDLNILALHLTIQLMVLLMDFTMTKRIHNAISYFIKVYSKIPNILLCLMTFPELQIFYTGGLFTLSDYRMQNEMVRSNVNIKNFDFMSSSLSKPNRYYIISYRNKDKSRIELLLQTLQLMSKKENFLLQKTQLGHVKKGFHDLPPQGHIYGKEPVKDKYGARQVVSGWEQFKPSNSKQPGKNFVAMNKEGAKAGCTDSKQFGSFRKENEIKCKVKQGQKYYGVNIPNQDFTYGIPNRPSTPIKNVICNTYAQQQAQLRKQREAVLKMLQKDNKKSPPKIEVKPKPMPENKKKALEENNFKLSKFKNVESKVKQTFQK